MNNKSTKYIVYKDFIFEVCGNIKDFKEYINGKGYIKDGVVYVYGKDKVIDRHVPHFEIDNSENMIFSELSSKSLLNFSVDNIIDLNIDEISNSVIEGESLYDEDMITILNASSNFIQIEVNESDDQFKKIIKTAIIEKGVNIKLFQNQVSNFNNAKTSLLGKTKMTPPVFNMWCELLGLSHTITVFDNGKDPIYPLMSPLEYNSDTNEIIIKED